MVATDPLLGDTILPVQGNSVRRTESIPGTRVGGGVKNRVQPVLGRVTNKSSPAQIQFRKDLINSR